MTHIMIEELTCNKTDLIFSEPVQVDVEKIDGIYQMSCPVLNIGVNAKTYMSGMKIMEAEIAATYRWALEAHRLFLEGQECPKLSEEQKRLLNVLERIVLEGRIWD